LPYTLSSEASAKIDVYQEESATSSYFIAFNDNTGNLASKQLLVRVYFDGSNYSQNVVELSGLDSTTSVAALSLTDAFFCVYNSGSAITQKLYLYRFEDTTQV
jgi:hypothetical protein